MARAWDVLYALLAFHLKDLSRDGLLEGLQGVSEDASDSLPSRLVKAGILSSEEAELIRRLAEAATQAHDGNAEAAVMSLGGEESLWKSLDPDRTLSTPSGRTTTPMQVTPFEVSHMYEIDPIEEIPGRYATTSEYGRGGMGRILLAHDMKMGRDIALKELLPTNETSMILPEKSPVRYTAAIAARFLQEGRVTAGLEHPSIVPVYEIGRRPNGNLYYTMKLVRGQSLARALRECKSLEERLSFLPHFVDLCEAVAYAHSRGVLHRDIKPSNVMIGEFGETVVLDWGLAKIKAHREDPLEAELRDMPRRLVNGETPLPETREGQAMGTPEYMSPEQAQGLVEQIDERSDLYSLGVVLYELLAGTTPFRAESASETMRRVVQNDAPPIRDKEPDAPAELVSICEKALQKKPSQRYESVRTLADEVKRFQTGALVQTYRYSLWELARRYYKRHRGALNVIGAAAAIVLCLAVISYIQIYQARNRADAQRELAEEARDIAIVAEEKAQKAKEEADHTAYLAQIRLLEAYVRNRNFARANTLVWSISEARRNWEWGYLLEQCNQDLFTLRGHESILFRTGFDHAGNRAVTLGGDKTARVWNANDGSVRHVLTKHERKVNDVAFSPDGSQLLSASDDGSVLCWDVDSGAVLYELAGHADHVASARFSPDGARILTASWDETVRVWEAGTGEELVALPGGEHPFLDAEFLGNSQSILVAGWDGHLTAHFAGPWRMEQLDGVAGSTLRERFEAAKATRLANRWPEHDALEGATVMIHTTEQRVRTHLGRLLTLLDQTAPYESESPGLAIAEGSIANAVRRLCLLPGDVVTRMNETPVQGYDSARTAIAEYLESGPEPELQLEMVREGEPLRVDFAFHPVIQAQNSVTLPREQAQKAVEYLAGALLAGIEQLLRVNQDMNTRIGEPVVSRETLNGLWVPSAGGPEGALLYETLGIATGDRIVRVNQSAIEELGQVRDFIHTARTALKDDTPVKLEVEAERGEFQTIHLTVEVK